MGSSCRHVAALRSASPPADGPSLTLYQLEPLLSVGGHPPCVRVVDLDECGRTRVRARRVTQSGGVSRPRSPAVFPRVRRHPARGSVSCLHSPPSPECRPVLGITGRVACSDGHLSPSDTQCGFPCVGWCGSVLLSSADCSSSGWTTIYVGTVLPKDGLGTSDFWQLWVKQDLVWT